ncbi:type I restriction-modification system subunit M [Fructilactobacillus sanfranciscensis]|uniref:site-specific DNA-methyltransferase (adenine-specific) n=1 Tax=Fructilactobacillus sanfranciscensis TaxID=1625 RepID=A0A5C4TJ30_FRUSA|nr:type I restriction-modification system subunit M [Fructilactobacillus sanfranciscensis]TNK90440.1 type I restriction-modification system subunit M [Fructilactobacillus sanfranciscensis]TNK97829.1 type I restriction-modification system subunit M [Fructilactobacillus sanfranciscensis]
MDKTETKSKSLENALWNSANVLRGKMDASEYKNYLLGLIFYRFLSEKTLQAVMDATGETENPIEVYKNYWAEQHDDIVSALYDDNGYIIAPEDLFDSIVDRIQKHHFQISDLKQVLFNLEQSVKGHPAESDFEGLFDDIDLDSNRLGKNPSQIINDVILALKDINFNEDRDVLGDAYEYLISSFAMSAGKKAGEFYTPRTVSEIIAQIVTINHKSGDEQLRSVYDPTMGSGSLLLTVAAQVTGDYPISYHGQELNTTTYNLARMNLMLHGVSYEDIHVHNGDTLDIDWPTEEPYQFDAVVMNPPYSAHWDNNKDRMSDPRFRDYGRLAPKSKADYAFLLHGLYHLKPTGTMGIVLPHGVLFRGAAEGKIREELIAKNQIDAVIGLPANIFYSTSIPTVIMILKKDKTDDNIMFIDASREFDKERNQNVLTDENVKKIVETYKKRENVDKYAHVASLAEIKENDYNLNIPRYVDTFEPEPPVDVDKLVKDMKETDAEIERLNGEIGSMLDELVGTDTDAQQQLDKIKELFK